MKKKIILIVIIVSVLLIIIGIGVNTFYLKSGKINPPVKTEKLENGATRGEDNKTVKTTIDSSNYEKQEDGTLVNISKNVKKEHSIENCTVGSMKISVSADDNEMADYTFTITNNTTTDMINVTPTITFILSDGTKFVNPIPTIEIIPAGKSVEVKEKSFVKILGSVDYEFSYVSN